jgi:hypothetical protein
VPLIHPRGRRVSDRRAISSRAPRTCLEVYFLAIYFFDATSMIVCDDVNSFNVSPAPPVKRLGNPAAFFCQPRKLFSDSPVSGVVSAMAAFCRRDIQIPATAHQQKRQVDSIPRRPAIFST